MDDLHRTDPAIRNLATREDLLELNTPGSGIISASDRASILSHLMTE